MSAREAITGLSRSSSFRTVVLPGTTTMTASGRARPCRGQGWIPDGEMLIDQPPIRVSRDLPLDISSGRYRFGLRHFAAGFRDRLGAEPAIVKQFFAVAVFDKTVRQRQPTQWTRIEALL